jgi:hypothetical protein
MLVFVRRVYKDASQVERLEEERHEKVQYVEFTDAWIHICFETGRKLSCPTSRVATVEEIPGP